MKTKEVKQGQSFLDIVLQSTGSIDNAVAMSLLNNCSITSDVIPGTVLEFSEITNKELSIYFSVDNQEPATNILLTSETNVPEGISYWSISNTFKVTAE